MHQGVTLKSEENAKTSKARVNENWNAPLRKFFPGLAEVLSVQRNLWDTPAVCSDTPCIAY